MEMIPMAKRADFILVWARCKLGPGRAYWFVGPLRGEAPEGHEMTILARGHAIFEDGYAGTVEEAESAALAVVRRLRGGFGEIWHAVASWAQTMHKVKVSDRRGGGARQDDRTGDAPREYVYTWNWSGLEEPLISWRAHPILKKTACRVFVMPVSFPLDRIGTEEEEEYYRTVQGPDLRAIVLDRQKLELDGIACSRRSFETFYVGPDSMPRQNSGSDARYRCPRCGRHDVRAEPRQGDPDWYLILYVCALDNYYRGIPVPAEELPNLREDRRPDGARDGGSDVMPAG
jgi:hypothetical protein